ncbi:contractile injection system protein, VgrG/Pvc8 family, partial [Paraburkholderia acidipaludis]|uniref:contractile injection system protein, VgrG/Pvc8 family n=1 Tax=Paraburkholderia acidipaludis TaxID=660537 RepID=UPI0005B93591
MNAVTKNFAVALRHPSARLRQLLRVWVGILQQDFQVVKFRVRGGFCKDYVVDLTVTASQLDLDGRQFVGRRAGLQIDERVAVPSVSYVDPVDHEAATFNGVITRMERTGVSRDEATYRLRIEPRFAALCKRIIRSDTFKDVTLQEMIRQALVDRKNFDAFDVEFQIEGLQEKMEEVVMYEESLW